MFAAHHAFLAFLAFVGTSGIRAGSRHLLSALLAVTIGVCLLLPFLSDLLCQKLQALLRIALVVSRVIEISPLPEKGHWT